MNKTIIRAIGRLPEHWHHEALHMYQERLTPFVSLQIIELPEGHQGSVKPDLQKTRLAEAESLLKGIPKDAFIIALDEAGKNLSSPMLAEKTKEWAQDSRPLVFLIGGSWGLDKTVIAQSHLVLSLGQLTLPHALARIVLLEQLYRVAMIQAGKTYHK